ncbi:unnamed protein product [Sympodiomycopsis kandeliae]
MPRVPYCYPSAGTSPIADAIRQRRGERGLTPLDGMLLNAPPIAEGWNKLLGAIRTGSSLQDDLREIMILRVAARNNAAFEWIHHEHVARKAGVTTEQLGRIGNLNQSLTNSGPGQLSALQAAAVRYADAMTANVNVKDSIFEQLQSELSKAQGGSDASQDEQSIRQKMVEATGTVAVYNMVSRFLVALDIDDRASQPVPVPGHNQQQQQPALDYPSQKTANDTSRGQVQVQGGETLSTRVHFHSMQAPWLVLINSLMTNLTMWDAVIPGLSSAGYNILRYDQRGHGGSSVPSEACTLEQLSDDVADLLTALGIQKAHAVIGVSQGGATALSFAIRHPDRTSYIIANDTQAVSPAANHQAWEDRIHLSQSEGMSALADATVNRWYGSNSDIPNLGEIKPRIHAMISSTDVKGFQQGARSLQSYDLLSAGLIDSFKKLQGVLLVAGEYDGKLPEGLKNLADRAESENIRFEQVEKAAHLPMVDQPQLWTRIVLQFLKARSG